jgi:DNA-binding NtrC family response regulator
MMKVLAIDDQPEALKQIEKAIAAAKGFDDQPYEVTALEDHDEALRRLEGGERFDAVITDMVMGPDEDEGLEILRKLTDKSPITIVLTAHPSIRNCAKSMQAGAWDYIEKIPTDGSDPYDNLLESLAKACKFRIDHPEAGRSNPDCGWFQEHYGEIMGDHPGEMVAVLDRRVVAHAKTYDELVERIEKDFPVARPMIVSIPEDQGETI